MSSIGLRRLSCSQHDRGQRILLEELSIRRNVACQLLDERVRPLYLLACSKTLVSLHVRALGTRAARTRQMLPRFHEIPQRLDCSKVVVCMQPDFVIATLLLRPLYVFASP